MPEETALQKAKRYASTAAAAERQGDTARATMLYDMSTKVLVDALDQDQVPSREVFEYKKVLDQFTASADALRQGPSARIGAGFVVSSSDEERIPVRI
jgi:hypothetical protein